MSRSSMPPLIPGALYKWRSKPTTNPTTGERIPDGFNTFLVKFIREDGSNYVWIMRQIKVNGMEINYDENNLTEFPVSKENLSKTFYVSQSDKTGGKKSRKGKKTRKGKKSRKNKK